MHVHKYGTGIQLILKKIVLNHVFGHILQISHS
jgi:hypothetical protein